MFADGTSCNVSKNARMEVDEFVYVDGHSNSTLLSVAKGTFTFVAGNIAHTGSMKVATPVGTMGFEGPLHALKSWMTALSSSRRSSNKSSALQKSFKSVRRLRCREVWVLEMRCHASPGLLRGAASVLMLIGLVTGAAAQSSKFSNVELCNGKDRTSAEFNIIGCTALIKSQENSAQVLAIAYNNRGNAYAGKGQYDLAIQDYDELIKPQTELRQTIQQWWRCLPKKRRV